MTSIIRAAGNNQSFFLWEKRSHHDLQMLDIEAADVGCVLEILGQYRDQQIDLADACLLHLANREGIDTVFTLDRRHFSVFRKTNGNSLNLIP